MVTVVSMVALPLIDLALFFLALVFVLVVEFYVLRITNSFPAIASPLIA